MITVITIEGLFCTLSLTERAFVDETDEVAPLLFTLSSLPALLQALSSPLSAPHSVNPASEFKLDDDDTQFPNDAFVYNPYGGACQVYAT